MDIRKFLWICHNVYFISKSLNLNYDKINNFSEISIVIKEDRKFFKNFIFVVIPI